MTAPASTIYVVNVSTLVTAQQAQSMVAAIARQVVEHFCPAWGLASVSVALTDKPPAGGRVITLSDTIDDPQALGYHTKEGARIYGVVGAKPTLDAGNAVLTGPYSVASILSHEVLELVADPLCASWADNGHGVLVAVEVCDPVQSDSYVLGGVTLSSFVFPAYFDPQASKTDRLDYNGTLRKPFTIDKGGYFVEMRGGKTSQVFGDEMPEWLIEAKHLEHTRTMRRSAGRVGVLVA